MADTVQQVIARVTMEDRFSSGLGRINGQLNGLGAIGNKAFRNAAANTERIMVRLGAVAVGGLGAAVKAAADFEDAFATVRKTIGTDLAQGGLDDKGFKELSQALIELSKRIPVTAVELADIAKVAGQLGIRGVDNITAFTDTIATLSRVTDLDVGYASEQLGKLGVIFDLSGSEYRKFGDALVYLGNNAASTEQEILDISRRFGAAAKAAGLAIPEVLAFGSTVASLGLLPEAAGSALSRLFNKFSQNIAVGNSKAKDLAKTLGMTFSELQKSYATDAAGTFQLLFKRLNELYESSDPMDRLRAGALLKDLGIINVRDAQVVQQLAQHYDELERQINLANIGFETSNALTKAAAERFASFKSQFQIFKNNVTAAGIVIGTALFPALNKLFLRISKWLTDNEDKIKKFAEELATGIGDFLDRLKPSHFDAIAGAIRTAATAAGILVKTFLDMPDWLRNLMVGGWALNKFTGGALGDLASFGLKGIWDQFMARGANPGNPVYVADVLGGGGVAGLVGSGAVLTFFSWAVPVIIGLAAAYFILNPPGGEQPRNIRPGMKQNPNYAEYKEHAGYMTAAAAENYINDQLIKQGQAREAAARAAAEAQVAAHSADAQKHHVPAQHGGLPPDERLEPPLRELDRKMERVHRQSSGIRTNTNATRTAVDRARSAIDSLRRRPMNTTINVYVEGKLIRTSLYQSTYGGGTIRRQTASNAGPGLQ